MQFYIQENSAGYQELAIAVASKRFAVANERS
jgi:hypothetical protein